MTRSNTIEIAGLTKRQQRQIEAQIAQHDRGTDPYQFPVRLAKKMMLEKFVMLPHVLQPMSSQGLARYLFANPRLYKGKQVIDIGSGSGLLGLTCALNGAEKVISSDVSPHAQKNTKLNFKNHNLENIGDALKGDLFEEINEPAQLIIFAQPYFPARPIKSIPVTLGMLDEGFLVQRFLEEAKSFHDGVILMPYLEWIGPVNHPQIQGRAKGYKVKKVFSCRSTGLQRGDFSIYELKLK